MSKSKKGESMLIKTQADKLMEITGVKAPVIAAKSKLLRKKAHEAELLARCVLQGDWSEAIRVAKEITDGGVKH